MTADAHFFGLLGFLAKPPEPRQNYIDYRKYTGTKNYKDEKGVKPSDKKIGPSYPNQAIEFRILVRLSPRFGGMLAELVSLPSASFASGRKFFFMVIFGRIT